MSAMLRAAVDLACDKARLTVRRILIDSIIPEVIYKRDGIGGLDGATDLYDCVRMMHPTARLELGVLRRGVWHRAPEGDLPR